MLFENIYGRDQEIMEKNFATVFSQKKKKSTEKAKWFAMDNRSTKKVIISLHL
jgi:hypothetical protein